jgi:hypothetical protein
MANPREETVTAERTPRKIAEETNRVSQHMAEASEHAARASAEMLTGNAETVQQIWKSGSELASRLAAQSADHFTRAFGMSGDEALEGTEQASRNLAAIVQSGSALTHGASAISTELFELMRKRIERSLDHMDKFMRCRTPQDLVAAQSDVLRDHLEGVIKGAHRIAEISLRTTDEASRKVTENVERVRRAA